ncbi:DegT/DnrJ/EryC1/StrS family aminotransferase [Streptomyces sp. NBC_00191]|uniref:DegT/DnrJ/EryC1/StrS family aminotransferase n=1 Tax=Streptomyces sp. NBC_00191 TaxID=2975674 RepID=UPI003248CC66
MIHDQAEMSDLWYAPVPRRPVGYLHPSRMTAGRFAATACAAARPRHARTGLAARLREHAGRNRCVLTASGRAALELAVRQTGAAEVVMSTFNCPAVADAVLAAGARPVLVDLDHVVGPAFTSVDLDGRAVVLTNALGLDEWRAHAERIEELGGRVVLDLAQASVAPRVLRRFRDAACPIVLSFGEGKQLGGLGGGALLTSAQHTSAPVAGAGGLRRGGELAPLRRAVVERIVAHAPGVVRAAVQRGQSRTPGWSYTKADHLPTEAGQVTQGGPSRWEVASAAALLRTASSVADEAALTHERVRSAVAPELTTCQPVAADPDFGPGIELVFRRPGQRLLFARALAERGVPSTWNYYPLHRLAPYAAFAAGSMAGADALWPRVLTVAKQPQPRLTAQLLVEAMVAVDRFVREQEAGRD